MEHWVARTNAEGGERAFHHLDALAALYDRTNDLQYARAMGPGFQAYASRAQRDDPERVDPLLWGIAYRCGCEAAGSAGPRDAARSSARRPCQQYRCLREPGCASVNVDRLQPGKAVSTRFPGSVPGRRRNVLPEMHCYSNQTWASWMGLRCQRAKRGRIHDPA